MKNKLSFEEKAYIASIMDVLAFAKDNNYMFKMSAITKINDKYSYGKFTILDVEQSNKLFEILHDLGYKTSLELRQLNHNQNVKKV